MCLADAAAGGCGPVKVYKPLARFSTLEGLQAWLAVTFGTRELLILVNQGPRLPCEEAGSPLTPLLENAASVGADVLFAVAKALADGEDLSEAADALPGRMVWAPAEAGAASGGADVVGADDAAGGDAAGAAATAAGADSTGERTLRALSAFVVLPEGSASPCDPGAQQQPRRGTGLAAPRHRGGSSAGAVPSDDAMRSQEDSYVNHLVRR